ncbi:MAG: Mur ligase family protein [Bdellovibrionota bacterium]
MNEKELQSLVDRATHFSSHSKEVGEGGIFVALRGENLDAHDFVPELLKKGILAAIVEKDMGDPRALVVPNAQETHWKIASLFRKKFKGVVIGVGGSSGKTSTKELLYSVLSQKFKCVKTEKSQNGLLGIPKTLEKLRPGIEVAIVEIGIDAPNEMLRNVSLVQPTHALLTSIGEEHLLLLKNLEGVFTEERILVDETIKRGGKAYVPSSDNYLSRLKEAQSVPSVPSVLDPSLKVEAQDKHTLQNMALAASVALDLGLSSDLIRDALNKAQPLDGRGLKWRLSDKLWVIRDHYNANPSSMAVAFESAVNFAREKALPLRLILGDMRELGEGSKGYHQELIEKARVLNPEAILWVGEELGALLKSELPSKQWHLVDSQSELSGDLVKEFKKDGVVLVKASRGTALEKVMDRIFGLHTTA